MKEWTFKVFIKSNGRDAFEEWIKIQGIDAEEKIRAMINLLSVTKIWDRPHFAKIHGSENIYEIRIKGKDKQYRPLGCKGPGPQIFTLLVGASKKENKWNPPEAIKMAEERCKLVFKDQRSIDKYGARARNTKKPS